MAKLAGLIDCFSDVLGMPRTAVEAYVKPLRKAGLIASSGRTGPNTPEMTAGDAANLLIAILCGSTTHAVERVVKCGGYKLSEFWGDHRKRAERRAMLEIIGLSEEHNFFDCVRGLLAIDHSSIDDDFIRNALSKSGIVLPEKAADPLPTDYITVAFAMDVAWSSDLVSLLVTIFKIGGSIDQENGIAQCQSRFIYRDFEFFDPSGGLRTTYSVYNETFERISEYLRT